jgi:hypothetical protein
LSQNLETIACFFWQIFTKKENAYIQRLSKHQSRGSTGVLFTTQKALLLMPEGASIILNAPVVAGKGPSVATRRRHPMTDLPVLQRHARRHHNRTLCYLLSKAILRSWQSELASHAIHLGHPPPGVITGDCAGPEF